MSKLWCMFLFALSIADSLRGSKIRQSYLSTIDQMKMVSAIEKGKTHVVFVKDTHGSMFCIKQYSDDPFKLIREAVSARIAERAAIPTAKVVQLIPAKQNFPGKSFRKQIASLQTMALGSSPKGRGDFPYPVYIKQKFESAADTKDEAGLCRGLMHNMSLHPDLARIAALDTFTNDNGRSRRNMSYDKATNCFCALDLASSFKFEQAKTLSEIAIRHVRSYIKDSSCRLTKAEIAGLEAYNDTLKRLLVQSSPEVMKKLLYEVLHEAGLSKGSMQDGAVDRDFVGAVYRLKEKMASQHKSVQILVRYIDMLLKKQKG